MRRTLLHDPYDVEALVFISNVLACRPPKNRDPEAEEIDQCALRIAELIEIIQPRFVVALGNIARDSILPGATARGKFTANDALNDFYHRRLENPETVLCYFSYHPSYISRCGGEKNLRNEKVVEAMEQYREINTIIRQITGGNLCISQST